MNLQAEDFETAYILQQELKKLCPNDQTIKEFDDYLPDYVKEQQAQKEEDEYYDEEYDEEEAAAEEKSEESEKSEKSEHSEGEFMTKEEEEEEERKHQEKVKKDNEEYGDPGSGYEWDSNVDSDGNPVKAEGEESEESEWYYEEDRLAWERGEYNPIPELLNKNPIFDKNYDELQEDKDRVKMMQGVGKVLGKDNKLKKRAPGAGAKRVGGGHKI